MTPFIFYYAFCLILAGIIILSIGSYVLIKSREPQNLLYFFLSLNLFAIAVCEAFLRTAPNMMVVNFWSKPWILGWALGFPIFLHFAAVFSRVKLKIMPILYLVGAAIFILRGFTPYFIAGFEKRYFGYA